MFTMNKTTLAIFGLAISLSGCSTLSDGRSATVTALYESEGYFNDKEGGKIDADDPAIWVHPTDPSRSLVIAALKEGGVAVFDLKAKTLQRLPAPKPPREDDKPGRINNMDLILGFNLNGQKVDLALGTDRGLDQVRMYRINPNYDTNNPPITDVTASNIPWVFNKNQDEVNKQATAYGIATAMLPSGSAVGFITQRNKPRLAKLEFFATNDGKVSYKVLKHIDFPKQFTLPNGKTWTTCDKRDGEGGQFEGAVIDVKTGWVYAAQEPVGIWRMKLDGSGATLVEKTKSFGVAYSREYNEKKKSYSCDTAKNASSPYAGRIEADSEGLTIYDDGNKRYLMASGQGNSMFHIYDIRGNDPVYVGNFLVVDGPSIDGVEHSDGSHVVSANLGPDYPQGLAVFHDGDNKPDVLDSKGKVREQTGFKFVPWHVIADQLDL